MNVTYNDVVRYQHCPLLVSNFKKNPDENTDILGQVLRSCFYRIFLRESELGHVPSLGSVTTGLSKYIKPLQNAKYSVKRINDVQILLKRAYDAYLEQIAGQYRTAAVKADLAYGVYEPGVNGHYFVQVPVLLIKDGKAVPVFDSKDIDSPRSNYIRFACATISSVFKLEVSEYILVHFAINEKGSIQLTKHSFNSQLIQCELELKNIINQMASRIQTPNTSRCIVCEFRRQCKI